MIVLLFSFSLFCAFVSSTFFQQARDAPNSRPLHVSPCKWMSLSPDFHLICSLNSIRYFLKGHFLERASLGDPSSIPGSGRSPGEGNGNPLQYSCLENSMDGEAWWATVHGVAKSQTWLSDFIFFHFLWPSSLTWQTFPIPHTTTPNPTAYYIPSFLYFLSLVLNAL